MKLVIKMRKKVTLTLYWRFHCMWLKISHGSTETEVRLEAWENRGYKDWLNVGRLSDIWTHHGLAEVTFNCFLQYGILFVVFYHADVNECEAGTSDCDDNADCENTEGSYNCSCNTGFTGNGTNCRGKKKTDHLLVTKQSEIHISVNSQMYEVRWGRGWFLIVQWN